MEFYIDEDNFFLFIEDGDNKGVLKFTRNYDWEIELEEGVYPRGLTSFRSQYGIDDIIDILSDSYDNVEQITEEEIDEYL
jgi:hypothetical protein